jgi:hypothetical protein
MTYDAVVPAYCESDPSSYPGALCDGQAGKWYNLILDDSTSEICALGQESDIETCAVYGCDCDGDGYVEDLHSYESGTAPGATAVGFCRLDPSNSNALCDDQVGEWYAGKSDSSNWGGSCTLGLQSEKPVENIYCKDNYDNDGDGAIDLYGGCDLDYDGIIDGNCSGAVDALACYSLCVNVGGIWYAPDSGCDVNNNASEYDRCGDGYDNDADGRIDYTGGCSTDGDLTIDYYCGCDEDRDGYVRPAEMRITKEDCSYDDGWGCNNARFDGPIAIELGRYQCEDGILYFPDEDCSGPGDDSERNYDLQSYVEGSSGTYQAPAFGESWIIKFWNFLFGS